MSEESNQDQRQPPRKQLTTSAAVAAVGGATYISLAIGLVRGILYTSVLSPTSRGIVQIVFLFGKYLSYSHLGIMHGLTKRVPLLLGEGDDERADHLERAGLTAIFILSVAAGAIMWGYAALAPSTGTATRFAIAIGGVHLVFGQLMGTFRVILRSHHHFGLIARATIVEAVVLLAFVVAGAQLLGAPGTMAGWALGLAAVCIYFLSFRLVPGTPRLDLPATVRLLTVGLPLLVVGLSDAWMRTADTVVIAKLLGAQALGYYGVAWQLSSYLYNLPASAGFVIMPKILRAHGEGGPEATRRSVLEMTKALAIVMPPLTGLAAIGGPVMVRLVLKQYLPAIPPLQILLMATVFVAVPTALHTTLVAQNRERELIAWQVLSGSITAGAVAWLIGRDAPLAHLALGTGIGWFVGGTAIIYRGLQSLGLEAGAALRQIGGYYVPFVYCTGALWGLKVLCARWSGVPSELVRDVICLIVFGLVTAPLLWYAERTTGIVRKLRAAGRDTRDLPSDVAQGPPRDEGGGEL